TFDDDVGDLDLVRRHFGLQHFAIIGHHWGAAVGAIYAAHHPDVVSRLMLLSPYPEHQSDLYELSLDQGDSAHYAQVIAMSSERSNPDTMAAQCRATWPLFFAPWHTASVTPYDSLAPLMCDAAPDRLARADWIRAQEQRSL